MLGSDEFVASFRAQVFDEVDEKGVDEWLSDEEDNLCTARRQASDYFSTYTGCSALLPLVGFNIIR